MQPSLFNSNISEISITYSCKVKAADCSQITKSEKAHEVFLEAFPSPEHIIIGQEKYYSFADDGRI
jgi:hypothetical protein